MEENGSGKALKIQVDVGQLFCTASLHASARYVSRLITRCTFRDNL